MRADIPGTSHWVDLRGPDELTIGDIDAYNKPLIDAIEAADQAGKDRESVPITLPMVFARRDALLGELITGWSFQDAPLPYTLASRKKIPIAALPVFRDLADPYIEVINGLEGPKASPEAPTADGDGSVTTSPDTSENAPPASPEPPSETAGG